MQALPSVVFVSCTEKKPEEVIELITSEEHKIKFTELEEGLSVAPWELNNKYYTALIHLCALDISRRKERGMPVLTAPEAIVVYSEARKPEDIEVVDDWCKRLKDYEVEIQILLCPEVLEEARDHFRQWCHKEGYELILLEAAEDEDEEIKGVERLWEALQAHEWPNLEEKKKTKDRRNETLGKLNQGHEDKIEQEDVKQLLEAEPEFSELFSQLNSIKQKASNLSGDERKDFAENIVRAYWKAIGGEDSEFSD